MSALIIAAFFLIIYIYNPDPNIPKRIIKLELIDIVPNWDIDVSSRAQLVDDTLVVVEDHLVQHMFLDVEPKLMPFLYKGGVLGIATYDDNTKHRIVLSYYGDSFKIQGIRGYYKVVGNSVVVYNETLKRVVEKCFIPSRFAPRSAQ